MDGIGPVSLTFSVAICTLNGERRLKSTLEALYAQIPSDIEVIVVDDGSTDHTSEVVKQWGATLIRHDVNMGYGKARQSALEACKTDVLVYVDDECVVAPNWFTNLKATWESKEYELIAVAGAIIPKSGGFFAGYLSRNNPFKPIRGQAGNEMSVARRYFQACFQFNEDGTGYILSSGNGNLSIRTRKIQEIGGYDTTKFSGGEDSDLCKRIRLFFGKESIYFNPKIIVTHSVDENLTGLLLRNFRYGFTAAENWRLNGGIPNISPFPITVVLLSLIAGFFTSNLTTLWMLTLLPILCSLPSLILGKRNFLYSLTDGYLRMLCDFSQNTGFIYGAIK